MQVILLTVLCRLVHPNPRYVMVLLVIVMSHMLVEAVIFGWEYLHMVNLSSSVGLHGEVDAAIFVEFN